MGKEFRDPFPMSSKLSSSLKLQSHNYVFNLLLFVMGLSVGVVATLCFQSFSLNWPAARFAVVSSNHNMRTLEASLLLPSQPLVSSPPGAPPPLAQKSVPASNGTSVQKSASLKDHKSLMHNMSDKELLSRASTIQQFTDHQNVPKVAFMFLTPGSLPLAPLWEKFFKGHDGRFSIYLHPHPSYNYTLPQSSVFYGRRIPSQPVQWGTMSMIDAERRLLANALLDSSNQIFVLVSDSCIPLFNFTTIYNYLVDSNQSFLGSFDDPREPGRGRYNRKMSPAITLEQWHKGSQWFAVRRDLALKIVSDSKYYTIFNQYCLPPCYNDEFYLPTMVHILYPKMSANRSVTWVDWSRGGPHPMKFGRSDITVELLNRIRYGSRCVYNGNTTSMCFLFARKFSPDTLEPLLRVAPSVLGLDP